MEFETSVQPKKEAVKRVKRVNRACTNCHKSKTRCSGLEPCGMCEKKNLHCYYERKQKDGDNKKGLQTKPPVLTPRITANILEVISDAEPLQKKEEDMSDLMMWDHHILFKQKLFYQSAQISWLDLYYTKVFPELPLIPRHLLDLYFYKFPIRLIHSMFAVTVFLTSTKPFQLMSFYISIFPSWINRHEDYCDLFDIIVKYHVAFISFSMKKYKVTRQNLIKMQKSVNRVIRVVQSLDQSNEYNAVMYGLACRSSCLLFIQDFDYTEIRKVFSPPFMFSSVDLNVDWIVGMKSGNPKNEFGTLLSYAKYLIPLRIILKNFQSIPLEHVTMFVIREALNKLFDLQRTFLTEFPVLEEKSYIPVMGFPWASYTVLEFYYAKVVLSKWDLLDAVYNHFDHKYQFDRYLGDASVVCNLLRALLIHNSNFAYVPVFVIHITYLTGMMLCALSLRFPEALSSIDDILHALEYMEGHFSVKDLSFKEQLYLTCQNPNLAQDYLLEYF